LGDYFAEHIFKPLGIDTEAMTMFPSQEAQQNLATGHQRDPETGKLKERDQFYGTSLKQTTKEQQNNYLQSGGAGLFAKPKEYIKVLAAILNEGTSAQTGKTILKKETVESLWENQIPNQYVHPSLS
jgi:CubicO group peptidase (beta-lactamase class C family)